MIDSRVVVLLSVLLLSLACALVIYHAAVGTKQFPRPWTAAALGLLSLLGLGIFLLATSSRKPAVDSSEPADHESGEAHSPRPTARQAAVLFFAVMCFGMAAGMFLGLIAAGGLRHAANLLGIILASQIGILLPTLFYARDLKLRFKPLFRWRMISLPTAILAVTAGLALSVLGGTLNALVAKVLGPPQMMDPTHLVATLPTWTRWACCLSIVLLPALGEEWMFRGFLLRAYAPKGRRTAILLTAVLFACFHCNAWEFMGILLIGIVLALVVEWTDSTLTSSLMHATNNLVAVTAILTASPAWVDINTSHSAVTKTLQLPPWPVVLGAAVVEGICLWGLWLLNEREVAPEERAIAPLNERLTFPDLIPEHSCDVDISNAGDQ